MVLGVDWVERILNGFARIESDFRMGGTDRMNVGSCLLVWYGAFWERMD